MSQAAPSVLVVDDDPALLDLLRTYLQANGLQVHTAGDARAFRAQMAQAQPDAIVMDLMLPGTDGLTLTREVRTHSSVPILMLSARGEDMDRIIGLEVGADDYLPKPFNPRELLARLRALLRRGQPAPGPGTNAGPTSAPAAPRLRFGPFELDTTAQRLLQNGQEVPLTHAEYTLLAALVARPHRVLSRDTLVELLRGLDRDPFDRSMDNRVTRLRRKIEPDPANPRYIRTVRGEGYWFNPDAGPA